VFTRGVNISDAAALEALAAESGLDPAGSEAVWNDPKWKARLKTECDAAVAAGMFGAPWIVVDGEPFWGNDRKVQIERWLAAGPF
jgi:2-hydroxychromene-2-carboxylate isomerase